jgi:hypothetical protein
MAIILRIVSGLALLFAGVVKLNDPVGYAVKLNEYSDQVKKNIAVPQDTLLVSLHDGLKSLSTVRFQLYASEVTKTLRIRQDIEVKTPPSPKDSARPNDSTLKNKQGKKLRRSAKKVQKPKATYWVKVGVFLDDQPAGDTTLVFKDSGTAALLSVQARIRNQSVFQKSFKVIASGKNQEQTNRLNLESFVKPESRTYHFFNGSKSYNIGISISICMLEFLLGFALICGWGKRFTLGFTVLLTLILSLLSGYIYLRGNIDNSGTFGQGIKISALWSWVKDLLLFVFALALLFLHEHFTPLFSRKTGGKIMPAMLLSAGLFGAYSYLLLPIWDVSDFKPGTNLQIHRKNKALQSICILQRQSDTMKLSAAEYTKNRIRLESEGWQLQRRIAKVAKPDWVAVNSEFSLFDAQLGRDLTDSFLAARGFKLLLVVPSVENAYEGGSSAISRLHKWAGKNKMMFTAATSSSILKSAAFTKRNKWPFQFVYAQKGLLEKMAGFNPVLYLIKDKTVVKKWSGLLLPDDSDLTRLTAK